MLAPFRVERLPRVYRLGGPPPAGARVQGRPADAPVRGGTWVIADGDVGGAIRGVMGSVMRGVTHGVIGGVMRGASLSGPHGAGRSTPASAAPPLVQLAPAAAAMTAAIAAASSGEMRWPSTMSAASAAIAGSMLSSTP